MKYLCLAYYDEKKCAALSKAEMETIGAECKAHDAELYASGKVMCVGSLAATQSSASVRPRSGTPSVTDGPYAETKEQIGAFFIIEAADLKEAIDTASKHPAAHLNEHLGWGIEIRPVEYFVQP